MTEKLPAMWNAHGTNIGIIIFTLFVLLLQVHPNINYGEAEWGLIVLVVREGLSIASKIANHYTGGS